MAPKRGRGRWGLGNGLAGALQRGRGRPSNVAGGGRWAVGAVWGPETGRGRPSNVAGHALEPLQKI